MNKLNNVAQWAFLINAFSILMHYNRNHRLYQSCPIMKTDCIFLFSYIFANMQSFQLCISIISHNQFFFSAIIDEKFAFRNLHFVRVRISQ